MSGDSEPSIRAARADEAAQLGELAVRSKAHWGYSESFMAACRAELSVSRADIARSDREYFVIVTGPDILGYYALERQSEHAWELEALFVEPSHIGHGYGRRLLAHACERIAAAGGGAMLIQGDPHAARFYRAAGAELIGERESDSVPGRYLPLFSLSVAGAGAPCD